MLLGTLQAIKQNATSVFAGTDLGFNVLVRPVMYDSWHDIEVYRQGKLLAGDQTSPVTVVGNICESGDIIARNRALPPLQEGDILAVLDTGAYGYSMSSNLQ